MEKVTQLGGGQFLLFFFVCGPPRMALEKLEWERTTTSKFEITKLRKSFFNGKCKYHGDALSLKFTLSC